MCGRSLFQSKTLECNSLFMSLILMRYRWQSSGWHQPSGGRASGPGWAARGRTAAYGPAADGLPASGEIRLAKKPPLTRPGDVRSQQQRTRWRELDVAFPCNWNGWIGNRSQGGFVRLSILGFIKEGGEGENGWWSVLLPENQRCLSPLLYWTTLKPAAGDRKIS